MLLANTPAKAEFLLISLEQTAEGISLHINANKIDYICFKREGAIFNLSGRPLKLVDKFTYFDSNISSTESYFNIRRLLLSTGYRSLGNLIFVDKIKRDFFQAVFVSILLYGCITWTLTKRIEKKLDGNYTRMLRAILNKSWKQHPIKQQLYGHIPLPPQKPFKVRQIRHTGHCWRIKDELISDVLLWTPIHERASFGRPAKTYLH